MSPGMVLQNAFENLGFLRLKYPLECIMQEVRRLELIIQIKVLTIYIFVTWCEKLIYDGYLNPFFDSNFFHNINADDIFCVPWL